MREIKFRAWAKIKYRAWDKKRKVMLGTDYPDNWGNDAYERYENNIFLAITGIEELSKNPDFVLMKWIGERDINQTDIYIGDVVKMNPRMDQEVVIEWKRGIATENRRGVCDVWEGIDWIRCEVIGNIYQNPELNPKK